jgi:hypothetical protein
LLKPAKVFETFIRLAKSEGLYGVEWFGANETPRKKRFMEEKHLLIKLLIPILAIVMGCGIPLLAIFMDYRKRKTLFELHHQERMAAIEKGVELPPLPESYFKNEDEKGKPRSPHSDFGWGLFWLLGGLALWLALYFNESPRTSLYGLIPVAIGLHYLIYYFAIGRKQALTLEAEPKTRIGQASQ